MQKSIILILSLVISLAISAQEIERSKSNLPKISEALSVLDDATGWVLQDNGSWLSEKNKILLYSSEQNLSADPLQKLGRQNFNKMSCAKY